MKKLTILLSFLVFVSCAKTKEQIMQESITVEFKKEMDDPSTFEFVSMSITEKITAGERKKIMNEKKLKEFEEMFNNSQSSTNKKQIESILKQKKTEYEFLKSKDDSFEAIYYVGFVARGSNSFGAIIKNNYSAVVLNDEKFTVVHLKEMEQVQNLWGL